MYEEDYSFHYIGNFIIENIYRSSKCFSQHYHPYIKEWDVCTKFRKELSNLLKENNININFIDYSKYCSNKCEMCKVLTCIMIAKYNNKKLQQVINEINDKIVIAKKNGLREFIFKREDITLTSLYFVKMIKHFRDAGYNVNTAFVKMSISWNCEND